MENNYNYQSYYQPTPPTPPKKKSSGMAKKVLIGLVTGLVFGIFAGLGFSAVTYTSNVVRKAEEKAPKMEERKMPEQAKEENDTINKITDGIEAVEEMFDSAKESDEDVEDPIVEDMEGNIALTPGVATTTVTDVTQVVKQVMPSVVAVNNKFVTRMSYFGQLYSQHAESAGSGIIVGKNDKELLLVTNFHVIDGAEELTVTFVNDEQAPAQVKGTNKDKDLAVIAVALKDIKTDTMNSISIAQMGNSDNLTVGEPVVAIGNSLGYGLSVTTGVVSALNRPIGIPNEDGDDISTFIQTDAAINPGNSGGALLNINGQVIGINSNKIGGSAVEGMGYAIPISDAKPIIENLMTKETKVKVTEAEKGYLGITGVNVEQQHAEAYGMPIGVYISSVSPESGADNAGLVRGDIIVGLNGEKIESMEQLKKELEYCAAGQTIELNVMQSSPTGYQSNTVLVTLGKQS